MNQLYTLNQLPWLQGLPHHTQILKQILECFENFLGFEGAFVAGSLARGQMDVYSDLDLGLVFERPEQMQAAWEQRDHWALNAFHHFDADHVKPFFVIYFFEPAIKADLGLYHPEALPQAGGAPYRWISTSRPAWVDTLELMEAPAPETAHTQLLERIVHDDERFWAWLFYVWQHTSRGACYAMCDEFKPLREICERWASWLFIEEGQPVHYRSLERQLPQDIQKALAAAFPAPGRTSLKAACESLMRLQLNLREHWQEKYLIAWRSSAETLQKIQRMYQRL